MQVNYKIVEYLPKPWPFYLSPPEKDGGLWLVILFC